MSQPWDYLLTDATIATLGDEGYGLIDHAALAWSEGRIAYVGPSAAIPSASRDSARRVEALGGALITPGLIDCHTHLVFAGDRAAEFELRLNGASYEDIARAGGGIVSTVANTRAASEDELLRQSLPRAQALCRDGVTTLEIKSGYGLDLASERKMLRVARRIGTQLGISVRTTYLGAHALPPEFVGRQSDYVDQVCADLPTLIGEGLVDAVDAFCEGIAFSPAEVSRVFAVASAAGLRVKLHADQLSNLRGGELAASFNALSADHLEYIDDEGVQAMARAGTVAVMLPGSFYALRETKLPPIAAFRAHGVPMAVSSDMNPGTSPLCSLRLAMNMACTLFRLTPMEALRGTTVNAARALGVHAAKGQLRVGADADLVVWDLQRPGELAYWIGGNPARRVFASGRELHSG